MSVSSFQAVTQEVLVDQIGMATRRVVFVAPGVTESLANALVAAAERPGISLTVIIDSDEDAYRIGFGDRSGIVALRVLCERAGVQVRQQPGLRIGMLVADDSLTIWSPTPSAVEAERSVGEPNGIVIRGEAASLLESAVGSVEGDGGSGDVEIGKQPLLPMDIDRTAAALEGNPPAPFDLSRKARVFSTRFQFVECTVQGAEWTQRKIKLSNLLLNADLPENIQDILETQIHPYQAGSDIALDVQGLVRGQRAFDQDGEPIMVPTRQVDLENAWKDITRQYLIRLSGFGMLIRKSDLPSFYLAVEGYEEVLAEWVEKFRERMQDDSESMVERISMIVKSRLANSQKRSGLKQIDIVDQVRKGLSRMRVIEPKVRIVMKDVSWLSTQDQEFTEALRAALPAHDLDGWFEEFTAARERDGEHDASAALRRS